MFHRDADLTLSGFRQCCVAEIIEGPEMVTRQGDHLAP